jgi:hypothetical protein
MILYGNLRCIRYLWSLKVRFVAQSPDVPLVYSFLFISITT